MGLAFAALLGLVQGITEFLPISSTAHLRIVPALLGRPDPGAAFTAVIQLGSLAAVILSFARDIIGMLTVDRRRMGLIIAGTVPIGIAGVTLKHYITGDARSLWVVAAMLIIIAIVLLVADRAGRQERSLDGLR